MADEVVSSTTRPTKNALNSIQLVPMLRVGTPGRDAPRRQSEYSARPEDDAERRGSMVPTRSMGTS